MSLWSLFGITECYAAAQGSTQAGFMSMLPMLLGFGVIFYFLFIRPQNKRATEHGQLLSNLSKGDEVLTTGGILGRVVKINDDFIVLSIADAVDVTLKKSAVANVLPKGSLKSI